MPKASEFVIGTDKEAKAARATGNRTEFRVRGAPNLQLRVTSGGGKSWALAYKSPATGKWAKIALGQYPAMGLAEAKAAASDTAASIRRGTDPIHDKRKAALAETFAELAARYMREHELRNARGGKRSRSTDEAQRILDRDILRFIGKIRAESVTRQHVMRVVEAVADRGSFVLADRALGLIRAIYNWGCGTGRLDRNPTLGLKKRNAGRAKTRVLSADEIRVFWQELATARGMTEQLRDVLCLQLLTGARVSEIAEVPRCEIDFDRRLWTLAAIRTKSEREHVLPMSPMAAAIFKAAIDRADAEGKARAERAGRVFTPSPWVFPSPTTKTHINAHAATRCMVRNREAFARAGLADSFNTHDLRRTVATHLGEMCVADEIIERILNHAPRTVAGKHYNHARHLVPMRRALEAWAERLEAIIEDGAPSTNVVELRVKDRT